MAFTPIRPLALMLAIAAPLALAACSMVQTQTFGESLDDASIGTQIKTKLFADSAWRRFGEVDVEVAGRFVLLSGRVPNDKDRADAERIAWTVSAVDEIANELVVGQRSIGRDFNDRWITEQVRARLLSDKEIKGVNYNIQVAHGVVYLLGLARSDDELQRAAQQASRVKDVQKVVSYVKVRDRALPEEVYADEQPLVDIAPDQEAAPIVAPEHQPTTRGQYRDPYASGSTPPPGAPGNLVPGGRSGSSNSGGLQSAPMTPLGSPR